MTFPPEPWSLHGDMHVSAFLVPWGALPADVTALPPGCRPVRVFGRAVVGTAWVAYTEPGVLTYRELMATLIVRRGWRLLPTVVRIWVDSGASRDGGRALWGIPKELAEFGTDPWTARDGSGPLARGSTRPRLRLPGPWPVRFRVVQTLDGAAKVSPVRARGGVAVERATFDAAPDGPLGWLAGRRPLLSFGLLGFAMAFGARRRGGALVTGGVEWSR